jgi:hypothetical protein
VPTAGTTCGLAFADRVPLQINDFHDLGGDPLVTLVLPVCEPKTVTGVLVCVAKPGSRFSENQLEMAAAFAMQAGLVLHLATAQRRMRELDVLTDRDRIASDLHDHVIQRLFAVGLSLQGALGADGPEGTSPDHRRPSTTCRRWCRRSEPRSSTCTAGRSPGCASASSRRSPDDRRFPVRPTVHISGPLSVVDALADHAEAVVREAISNVVRHAGARTVSVSVTVDDDLTIGVTDDGVGIGGDVTRSGLANLAARAEECRAVQHRPGPRRWHTPALVGAAALGVRRRSPRRDAARSGPALPLDEHRHELPDPRESKPRWASATASLITSSGTSGNACTRRSTTRSMWRCSSAWCTPVIIECGRSKGWRSGSGPIPGSTPTPARPASTGREHRHEPVQRLLDVAARRRRAS